MGMAWGSGWHPVDISVREHHKAIKARTMRKYRESGTGSSAKAPTSTQSIGGVTTTGFGGMQGYSRYAAQGKGLTDSAQRLFATLLSGDAYRDYTTFVDKYGIRKARGSWQAVGHTEGSLLRGENMLKAPVIPQQRGVPQMNFPNYAELFKFPTQANLGGVADPAGNRGTGGWLAMLRGRGGGLGIPPAEDTKGGIGGLGLGIALILLKVIT